MEEMNRMSTPENIFWKLVDTSTGAGNHDIDWSFTDGDLVNYRQSVETGVDLGQQVARWTLKRYFRPES